MSVEGYLQHYAEPEVSLATGLSGTWNHAVVVPCCDEFDGIGPLLASLDRAANRAGGGSLVVLVINGRESAANKVHDTNRRLLKSVGGAGLQAHSISSSSIGHRRMSDCRAARVSVWLERSAVIW